MGYRFNDKPPKPEDNLIRFAVRNGATAKIAFACYYLNGHNPKYHDYQGWPNPDHPDMICQELGNFKLFGLKEKTVELEVIHLEEEGYDEVAVAYEDSEYAQYLVTNATLEDNIVRIKVMAKLPAFTDKPVDIRFTAFVRNSSESVIDAVCHGMLTILPGPIYPGSPYPKS